MLKNNKTTQPAASWFETLTLVFEILLNEDMNN